MGKTIPDILPEPVISLPAAAHPAAAKPTTGTYSKTTASFIKTIVGAPKMIFIGMAIIIWYYNCFKKFD